MSYNVETWKTKRLEGFRILLDDLYSHERKDFHPDRPLLREDGKWLINEGGGGIEILGSLVDGWFAVEEISIHGEFSGTFLREVMTPVFAHSEGTLVAIQVWEGGEEITRLSVKDGKVKWQDIEL